MCGLGTFTKSDHCVGLGTFTKSDHCVGLGTFTLIIHLLMFYMSLLHCFISVGLGPRCVIAFLFRLEQFTITLIVFVQTLQLQKSK